MGFDIDLLWLVLAGLVVIFSVIVLLAARGIRRAVAERGPRGRRAPQRDDS